MPDAPAWARGRSYQTGATSNTRHAGASKRARICASEMRRGFDQGSGFASEKQAR